MKFNMLKSIIVLCIAGAVVYGGVYINRIYKYKNAVKEIRIDDITKYNLKDGSYTGLCNVGEIEAEVKVVLKDNKIENIDILEHKNGRGKKAECIIDEVVKKQSLKVDTISGATNSSKVILKAIENAVKKGII